MEKSILQSQNILNQNISKETSFHSLSPNRPFICGEIIFQHTLFSLWHRVYPLNVERHRCVLYSFSVASALPSCSCLLNVEYCPISTIQLHNTVTLFQIHSSILKAKKKHQCKNYHQLISLNQVAIELSAQLTVLSGLTCDESASKLIQVVC